MNRSGAGRGRRKKSALFGSSIFCVGQANDDRPQHHRPAGPRHCRESPRSKDPSRDFLGEMACRSRDTLIGEGQRLVLGA
jgi:hypothetical protein